MPNGAPTARKNTPDKFTGTNGPGKLTGTNGGHLRPPATNYVEFSQDSSVSPSLDPHQLSH